ncbi:MAG TPA: hypothetical protein VLL27_04560 [Solirubrobacterales bacterium]|nr:hypothetical protein [Solirubrobacterales bacterium]
MIGAVTWAEGLEAGATVLGSVGVVAALAYTARQTHAISNQAQLQVDEAQRNVELQRANLELQLMELTISLDRVFLDRPSLRPYFYENRPLRWWNSAKRRAEVISVAEIVIDFVDSVACLRRHGQISDRDYENWRVFTESYHQQSPAVRQLWRHWGEFYLPETADLFSGQDGPTDLHTEFETQRLWHRLAQRAAPRFPLFRSAGDGSPRG